MELTVVTFNVLSSELSSGASFPLCDKEDLCPINRLEALKRMLTDWMRAGIIVCLQEVSREWHAQLLPLVRKCGYTMIWSSYGHKKTGYMGVAILYSETFELEDMADVAVANEAKWPRKDIPAPSWYWPDWRAWRVAKYMGVVTPDLHDDVADSAWRTNTALMVRLRMRIKPRVDEGWELGRSFVIATYHMPCAFKYQGVMMLHAAAVTKQLFQFARENPAILAGDFNFTPREPPYEIVTTGAPASSSLYDFVHDNPQLNKGHVSVGIPLRSVQDERCAPLAFTCYSQTAFRGGEPSKFKGVIDHIFMTAEWEYKQGSPSVQDVPAEYGKSLPCALMPSDHIPVNATLYLDL